MEKKDVVVVTGSCGRIGTQIVKKLGSDHSIVGFELLKAIYASDQEELVPVDLSSDESVTQAFAHIKNFYGNRIASVIHLAAYYTFKTKESPLYDKVTVKGTERLLKALESFEVEQFLFTSTMLMHAPTEPGHPISEDSPLCGDWGYPRSKIETEKLIHEKRGKTPTVILRVAGVYDDMCHSIPISNQIQRIYEKQFQARFFPGNIHHGASFVHMDDLVNAIVLAVKKRKELPEELTAIIAEPETMSTDQMQREISKLLYNTEFTTYRIPKILAKIGAWLQCHIPGGPDPFIRPWMIDFADDHYEMNIDLAKKTLGWSPEHSVQKTLPVMIEALKKDPEKWYKVNGLNIPYSMMRKIREK